MIQFAIPSTRSREILQEYDDGYRSVILAYPLQHGHLDALVLAQLKEKNRVSVDHVDVLVPPVANRGLEWIPPVPRLGLRDRCLILLETDDLYAEAPDARVGVLHAACERQGHLDKKEGLPEHDDALKRGPVELAATLTVRESVRVPA